MKGCLLPQVTPSYNKSCFFLNKGIPKCFSPRQPLLPFCLRLWLLRTQAFSLSCVSFVFLPSHPDSPSSCSHFTLRHTNAIQKSDRRFKLDNNVWTFHQWWTSNLGLFALRFVFQLFFFLILKDSCKGNLKVKVVFKERGGWKMSYTWSIFKISERNNARISLIGVQACIYLYLISWKLLRLVCPRLEVSLSEYVWVLVIVGYCGASAEHWHLLPTIWPLIAFTRSLLLAPYWCHAPGASGCHCRRC